MSFRYNDQYTRRVIAVFWGSLKAAEKSSSREPSSASWRQIKENRKIEELILFFVTTATQALRKDPTLSGDGWKHELDAQTSQFVLILRECLRNISHVPPEIMSRLELYTTRLAEGMQNPSASTAGGRGVAAGQASAGTSDTARPTLGTVDDMPLVNVVGKLFEKSKKELQNDLSVIRQFCSEKSALTDLKVCRYPISVSALIITLQTCLKNINADMPFPGRREDFDTEDAFHRWRTQELAHLSQLMLAMIRHKPDLAKAMPSESSPRYPQPQRPLSVSLVPVGSELGPNVGGIISDGDTVTSDDEIEVGQTFTYIPPNPKKAYKRLVELCLERDLEAMVHLPEDQEVSLTILSHQHLDLLNEAALRWRISHSYRVTCFLDVIRYKYERDEVPIECIPEGLQMVEKAMHDLPVEFWSRFDVSDSCTFCFGSLILQAIQDGLRLNRIWGVV